MQQQPSSKNLFHERLVRVVQAVSFSRSQWLILFVCATANLSAHEFWLQPHEYHLNRPSKVNVDWRIGMEFKGEPYVYLPSMATQVAVVQRGQWQPLSPRFAAKPALKVAAQLGTNIVVTESTDFDIRYENRAAFEHFLLVDGVPEPIELERLAPSAPVFERYRRFAKSLITVGDPRWQDRRVGLDLEWVIARNDKVLTAQLLDQGVPAALRVATLYWRTESGVEHWRGLTDDQGMIKVDTMEANQVYLLNGLDLTALSDAENAPESPFWYSRWASVTFRWPDASDLQ